MRVWRRDHPASELQRRRGIARATVGVYLRRGKLQRGPCEQAGEQCRGGIEAHHDDYRKPLKVRWLCRFHRLQLRRQIAAQKM